MTDLNVELARWQAVVDREMHKKPPRPAKAKDTVRQGRPFTPPTVYLYQEALEAAFLRGGFGHLERTLIPRAVEVLRDVPEPICISWLIDYLLPKHHVELRNMASAILSYHAYLGLREHRSFVASPTTPYRYSRWHAAKEIK